MPSRQELEEFKQFVLAQAPADASEEEKQQFVDYAFQQQGFEMPEQGPMDALKNYGGQALDYGIRALDYAGGLARTGAAAAADPFVDQDIVQSRDLMSALQGQAPPTEEFLTRAGVPEGASVSDVLPGLYSETGSGLPLEQGGFMDPNVRDVVGFAGDVALDPLTYLSLGGSAALKQGAKGAGKAAETAAKTVDLATNIGGKTTKKAGESFYKSGFKREVSKLTERGLNADKALDDIFEQGLKGTKKGFTKKVNNRIQELSLERNLLFGQLDDAARVNMDKAVEPSIRKISRLVDEKRITPDNAEQMFDFIGNIRGQGDLTLKEASNLKTSLYERLPESAFDAFGRQKQDFKSIVKNVGKGIRDQVEDAAEVVRKGAGSDVADINEKWGGLISLGKPLRAEARKAGGRDLLTQTKAALTALNPWATAAMYGAQGINSSPFRTYTGRGLARAGQSGLVDPVVRRMMIDSNRPDGAPISAWQKVGDL